MAKPGNKNSIEEQINELNLQYDSLLEKGVEFSVLRGIKDQLRDLKQQLSNGKLNGQSNGDGSHTHHSANKNDGQAN